jgi:hypothetical protein
MMPKETLLWRVECDDRLVGEAAILCVCLRLFGGGWVGG